MKRVLVNLIVLVALVLSYFAFIPPLEVRAFSGAGSGTEPDPYIITTATQLQEMENALAAWYELGNDIDASATSGWNGGAGFDPIGSPGTEFTGHFDGAGYEIDSLYINRPAENNVGLFGEIEGTAVVHVTIDDVGLTNADITGNSDVGGLIGGRADYSEISNCYVSGSVSGVSAVGGLIGEAGAQSVEIYRCYSAGSVSASDGAAGGFIGTMDGAAGKVSTVDESYSTCDVVSDLDGSDGNSRAAGFIAAIGDYVQISDCYARGASITDGDYSAGFIASISSAGVGDTIDDCYSTGFVSSLDDLADYIGGLIGRDTGASITNCFWDINTSAQMTSDGGTGKTTTQMTTETTFTGAGWDFSSIWLMQSYINDGYPSLQWAETLTLDTDAATDITGTSFEAQGEIVATTIACSRRGFAYMVGVAGDPDVNDSTEEETGSFWAGTYSLGITGLTPGTSYRVRAYAENTFKGLVYGDTVTVATLDTPIVETLEALHFAWMESTERRLQGFLTDEGVGACEYRFQYGTTSGSYAWETEWTGSINTGETFTEDIEDLEGGETYYFRAQARNNDGIGSGDEESFTISTGPPTVVTIAASDITTTGATLNGFLSNDGGYTCEYRFQYGVNPGCYIYETTWLNTLETGDAFSQEITGLTTGQTYYFRAQAENDEGISSGDQMSFVAGEGLEEEVLSVTTLTPNDISGTYFVARGSITNAIPNAQRRGFVYLQGTTGIPDLTDSVVQEAGSFGTGTYSLLIDGLTEGTHYRVRAFAENPLATAYGSTITVKTVGDVVIVTVDASNVALTTARLNSAVMDDGGQPVRIEFGWGTTSQAAIEDYDHYETLPGYYNDDDYPFLDIMDLAANTTYYFRVEATNDVDSDLGDELTFTTGAALTTPHNFVGYPYDTWISLHWAKGTATTNSLIRYSVNTFPTLVTEGEEVYLGANTSYIHEGLTPGTTYYYSLWGESGGTYTGSYVTLMLTTHASGEDTDDFSPPTTPSRWLSDPDYTNLSGLLFFYDGVNGSADSLGMPRGTMWIILAIVITVAISVAVYQAAKGKMIPAWIALVLGLVFWWVVLIIPFWIPMVTIIITVAVSISRREVAY